MERRDLEETLAHTRARLAAREAEELVLQQRVAHARALLEVLSRHRKRGRVRGLDSAQRGAVRTVLLSLACVGLISGASVLDEALGGAAIAVAFALLAFEGAR